MILRGILDSSLGGLVCVRGFAPLTELAALSYSDRKVQRELVPEHRDQLREYMRQGDPTFFPEVILSCQLERMYRGEGGSPPAGLLRTLIEGNGRLTRKVGGLRIERRTISYETGQDIRARRTLYLATLDFEEALWRDTDERALLRLDGNHRLDANDDSESFGRLMTPFCVIFFDEYNSGKGYDKSIFYTINSKAMPLEPEEGFREFIDDELTFPDSRLSEDEAFGPDFVHTRHLLRIADFRQRPVIHLRNLAAAFAQPRKTSIALFKHLRDENLLEAGGEVEAVFQSLRDLDAFYGQEDRLSGNGCAGLLIALVHFHVKGNAALSRTFRNWVVSNHLYGLAEVEAGSLINIFNKLIAARKRTIFVSMDYGADVGRHYDMIKEAVAEINRDFPSNLKIEEIRMDKEAARHSYQITDEIMRLIKDSGFLIADLTKSNVNVYHEVGYLMGLNDGKGLPQDNFLLILKQDDDELSDRVGFNLRSRNHIRFTDTADLKNKIKESILKYYHSSVNSP